MNEYQALKSRVAVGWNTWNTRSVLSQVCLPQGFALNLCFRSVADGSYLKTALIGSEDIHPGRHAYNGSYTDLTITWQARTFRVQTCHDGHDLLMLVSPLQPINPRMQIVVEGGVLWNRPGYVFRTSDSIVGKVGGADIPVYGTNPAVNVQNIDTQTPYLAFDISSQVGISTGRKRSLDDIQSVMSRRREDDITPARVRFGDDYEVYNAIQSSLA